MSIKQKLTWAFAVIAGLPIVLVATLVVLNLRGEARDGFLDSSSREIRQVSNAMNIFFQGISQNVEYMASQPLVAATGSELSKYMSATPSYELGPQASNILAFMTSLANAHPGYAYLSYGVADGGYVGWPAGQKFVNYDPRTRPWYQLAMANPPQMDSSSGWAWTATPRSPVRSPSSGISFIVGLPGRVGVIECLGIDGPEPFRDRGEGTGPLPYRPGGDPARWACEFGGTPHDDPVADQRQRQRLA